jgi:hypothetical protein
MPDESRVPPFSALKAMIGRLYRLKERVPDHDLFECRCRECRLFWRHVGYMTRTYGQR